MKRARLLLGLLGLSILAAVVVIIVRPSSSGPAVNSGPLGPPTRAVFECLLGRLGGADTEGSLLLTNRGHDTVAIDRLSLAAPDKLRLAGAYAVPGRWLVGTWNEFPPPASQLPAAVQWSRRRAPAGARVLPGHSVNIVVGLAPTSHATGRTAGVQVWYHDGRTDYEYRSGIQVTVKQPPNRCT
jgi:hypothetical protein